MKIILKIFILLACLFNFQANASGGWQKCTNTSVGRFNSEVIGRTNIEPSKANLNTWYIEKNEVKKDERISYYHFYRIKINIDGDDPRTSSIVERSHSIFLKLSGSSIYKSLNIIDGLKKVLIQTGPADFHYVISKEDYQYYEYRGDNCDIKVGPFTETTYSLEIPNNKGYKLVFFSK